MDGGAGSIPGRRQPFVLQRVLTECETDRQALYWRNPDDAVTCDGDACLGVGAGAVLSFDTYFNSFFEAQWRRYTVLDVLVLQVEVEGAGTLRVHRQALGCKRLVHEQAVSEGRTTVRLANGAINFRQHGVLSMELEAGDQPLKFVSGCWLAEQAPVLDVGLAVVFCTFNREADIARVLGRLALDPGAVERLGRIYVIDQGRPGLGQHPAMHDAVRRLGDQVRLIRQANFGGCGGFTRGLIAACEEPGMTHAVLLDDDIRIEPDCLLRMAAFFSLCRQDLVLGGHMLDLLQPTTLYEAGAVITDRHWNFVPQHYELDIGRPGSLEVLSRPAAVHYNGWWCCGLPLSLVRRYGLPMPCFIRGDDVELGVRLHQQGVPTVSMPGIAVWHEPFYLKLGSWQLYYETRNMLVTATLHGLSGRLGMVRRIARQVIGNLLTFRYYSAALVLQAARDFLAGPAIMHAPPLPLHTGLAALKERFPPATTRRELVLQDQALARAPIGKARCIGLLISLLARNALAPTPEAPARLLDASHHNWLEMRGVDHVAVETWWDSERPTYSRSREHHRLLLAEAIPLLFRLYRDLPKVGAAWRTAFPAMVAMPFWRRYLGLAAEAEPVRAAENADT